MNASYRLNTCKSRGSARACFGMFVAATGARVSNACPTYPAPGLNTAKAVLVPDAPLVPHGIGGKVPAVRDGGASH